MAKRLTLDIICSVIFGQEAGSVREALATDFPAMVRAALSIPVKIPFTRFSRGLSASQRIRELLRGIARERETLLQQQQAHGASAADDFFTYMLALRAEGAQSLTVEDIVDNAIFLLIAGYETTSVLITFMLWHLDKEPEVLSKITEGEQLVVVLLRCVDITTVSVFDLLLSSITFFSQSKMRLPGTRDLRML